MLLENQLRCVLFSTSMMAFFLLYIFFRLQTWAKRVKSSQHFFFLPLPLDCVEGVGENRECLQCQIKCVYFEEKYYSKRNFFFHPRFSLDSNWVLFFSWVYMRECESARVDEFDAVYFECYLIEKIELSLFTQYQNSHQIDDWMWIDIKDTQTHIMLY